jgi:hypothetical protein
MFQAPVSESRSQDPEARTQTMPEPHRDLCSHIAIPASRHAKALAGAGLPSGRNQLRRLQSALGNQAMMRSLSETTPRIQTKPWTMNPATLTKKRRTLSQIGCYACHKLLNGMRVPCLRFPVLRSCNGPPRIKENKPTNPCG